MNFLADTKFNQNLSKNSTNKNRHRDLKTLSSFAILFINTVQRSMNLKNNVAVTRLEYLLHIQTARLKKKEYFTLFVVFPVPSGKCLIVP